ncbi:MAG: hypothetical protein K0U41_06985, partial [Gammaproteobacteria bacterium]|nr:hypothetical protein [Gammaproteobacteria bacterium]
MATTPKRPGKISGSSSKVSSPKTSSMIASTPNAAILNLQSFDSIVWTFNALFMTICLGAIGRQMSLNLFIGIVIGAAISLGLYFLRNRKGAGIFFKYSLRVNMAVLFLGILTAAFFLWSNLLDGLQLAIAEHTVILFFLLGLSSTSALLKMIAEKYTKALSIEQRVKQMMGGPSLP